jgi:4-coumarate--CoA ligase
MPTESFYPSFEVPKLGLWDFLFERKDREFPDDKGESWQRYLSYRYIV